MLTRINDVLVPHDINTDMLDFILANNGVGRFLICMYIAEASDFRFMYDTAHIVVDTDGELRVHSQRTSRHYQLHMYAWEHVYCLMPSAKAKRKLNSGWIHPQAHQFVQEPDFEKGWHQTDIKKFVGQHHAAE